MRFSRVIASFLTASIEVGELPGSLNDDPSRSQLSTCRSRFAVAQKSVTAVSVAGLSSASLSRGPEREDPLLLKAAQGGSARRRGGGALPAPKCRCGRAGNALRGGGSADANA
jgi:hypothetical protein